MPTKPADLSLRFSAKSAAWAICLTTLGPLFFATAFSSVAVAQGQQATMQAAERAAMEAQGGPSGYEEMEPGYDDMDMYDAEMEDQGMGDPYGESGYGSGYGGQSNSRGGGDLKPSPTVMLEVFQLDWSPLAERVQQVLTSASTSQQPVALGPVLRNEAHVAYRYGNLPLALQLFHGFIARGSDAAEQQMDQIKFSKHFRKPLWHLRVGVSLGVHGDSSTTDPSPITDSGTSRGMGNGEMGMGMDSGMMDMEMEMANSMQGMEDAMREGMAGMEEEMGMGGMDMYEEDMGMAGMGMSGMGMSGRGRRDRAAASLVPKAEMTDSEVSARMEKFLGLVADTVKNGLSKRISDGKFGHALVDVEAESTTQGHTVNGETVDEAPQSMWIPSVLFVGEGNSRDTIKTAHYLELDLLFHFDVGLKENRMGAVSNISRVKVMDARTGKTLVSSGAMDNTEVERITRVGRGSPAVYVDEQMKSLWAVVDERLTLSDLPTLSPEVARKRVAQVLGDRSMTPLRKLAEIRYYGYRGWLTPDEVEQAFEITGGPDAMKVLHGSESQAIEAIHKLVVETEASDS
ncbi:hypothetical protein RBSH_02785 [Rhodopirellula baltica SH28]|uniref:Uncharacterized protein n=1 Tax=Rhodopirellula baltica SH28 TaxID=993517 RepID=K5DGI1_RHOBT|nr:hypothetical protein [Rhodopirellula baltica]EKK01939.1 hypothetical protein RBSH_02785 [Rhodopirellula baltica SH28]